MRPNSSQTDLYYRWSSDARRSGFFRAGQRVGVAVSGGADSMLLLVLMKQLASELGFTLAAVHFNHHLRGAESDADEQFVRERAAQLGIDCLCSEADVARHAREKRRNLEATARDLRYCFFLSLIAEGPLDKVATAHTASDQAETVLLRLLRGTGSRGLGGIYPDLEGKIVRPFLSINREEIELELAERKLEWRLDSSNLNPRFRRNKIRLELLPWLRKEFNPEITRSLKTLADRARDDEEYLEGQARDHARAWRVREGNTDRIPVAALREFPAAIARRVVRQMIVAGQGHLRGIAFHHVESLRQLAAQSQSGRRLVLPGGLEAHKEFKWLIIAPPPPGEGDRDFCCPVKIPGTITLTGPGLIFRFKIVGPGIAPKAYNGFEAVGLDPRQLAEPLVLRNWHAGDRFRITGNGRERSLKELFARRKIPLSKRKTWPVLASGKQIIWVWDFPPAIGSQGATSYERLAVQVQKLGLHAGKSVKVGDPEDSDSSGRVRV